MSQIAHRVVILFVSVIIVVFVGCGNRQLPTYPVNGQLEFQDGTTPKFGTIEFYNAEHQINGRGKINRDGTFTISTYGNNDGAVAGHHKIAIIQLTGNYLTAQANKHIQHDHGALVHQKYSDYRTSNLECTIVESDNDIKLIVERNPNQTEDGMPQ